MTFKDILQNPSKYKSKKLQITNLDSVTKEIIEYNIGMYFNISRIEKKETYTNIYLDFGRYEKENKLYTKSSFF